MEITIQPPEGTVLPEELAALIAARLAALERFGSAVRQVVVRLDDMEKPPGTCDKMCYLIVQLAPEGEEMNLSVGPDYYAALCLAAQRIEGVIERALARR